MCDYHKINNANELVQEKGRYYPYLMQSMGCPVINGTLIPTPSIKYLYPSHIEGLMHGLLNICRVKIGSDGVKDYSDRLFPVIHKQEFIDSMMWAVADCFYDGCEPDAYDEEKVSAFLNKKEYQGIVDPFS